MTLYLTKEDGALEEIGEIYPPTQIEAEIQGGEIEDGEIEISVVDTMPLNDNPR